ncbi:MAG TPA: hypothetical protein VK203_13495 [Nostocaceae cyanobacterium]|nr:hypothetical protein [Nostocaceae cyanobacterium]
MTKPLLALSLLGWSRVWVMGVNLTRNGRLETASTQAKPTCVGLKTLIFH